MCGAELTALPEGAQRVAAVLQAAGHPHLPVMLQDSARTAQEAADALGVALGQIAKSIVFKRRSDGACVLVVTSGDRRVDERKVEALVCPDDTRVGRADADFVKTRTGFSIGGVSPLAHATKVIVLLDRSLMRFDEVWAAAGHPHAVFRAMPQELELLTGAPVVDVAVVIDEEKLARDEAVRQVTARFKAAEAAGEPLPSPCISVCRLHPETGICLGCFRTLEEIAAWSGSTPEAKRAMWGVIHQRMAALPA